MKKITVAQSNALKWLARHGSQGGFLKWPSHHVLLAGGEVAPVMRSTWTALEKHGLVAIAERRVTITPAGMAVVSS